MIAVPLRYKRAERGLFIQKLQHAVPSIVVLGDGLAHLSHNPRGAELALGVFEVGAATAVMVSVVKGIRQLRRAAPAADTHAHHGIDWIDLFIGVMLAVEAYAKFHASGKLPRPTILLAVTMVAVGLMHGKIAAFGDRRRELRVEPTASACQAGSFSACPWHGPTSRPSTLVNATRGSPPTTGARSASTSPTC